MKGSYPWVEGSYPWTEGSITLPKTNFTFIYDHANPIIWSQFYLAYYYLSIFMTKGIDVTLTPPPIFENSAIFLGAPKIEKNK